MQPPKPTDDYGHGQMMGMLVVIMLVENLRASNAELSQETLNTIKGIAVKDLAEYFNKPEEDVFLMVEQQLSEV